jgi:hypothetical protein
MSFLRQDGELVFASAGEVFTYYLALIDELTPQLNGVAQADFQAIRSELANLRRDLARHLKHFGHNQVDDYFEQAMESSESEQEYYDLSNAYETILQAEIARLKAKLHRLRTT